MTVLCAGELVTDSTQALLVRRYLAGARHRRGPERRAATWRPASVLPPPQTQLPATLELATSYIEQHAAEPIGLTEIADAVRLSRRALQAGFRRHLGTTPLGYLRSVRMDRAHAALETARPGDGQTVSAVATAWEFTQLSRFARDYKQRFGVSPRDTLSRPR